MLACYYAAVLVPVPHKIEAATSARLTSVQAEVRQGYAAWYLRGLDRGEVAATVSPELAARYIDTQITTMFLQMAAGEEPDLVRAQASLAVAALFAA